MNLHGHDWPQGGTKQVIYGNSHSHIIELFVGLGGRWQSADLTALTGAPVLWGSALIGYAWPQGGTQQVVYVDSNGHIIELFVAVGGPWQMADLTALTDAPLADRGILTAYAWSSGGGTKQVVYVDSNGHIIELFVATGGRWQLADLTALTDAPLSSGSAIVGYDWPNGGTQQVVYVDDNGHIIELFVAVGGRWQLADLTALTGAPQQNGSGLTAYAWSAGRTKQVAYVADNGHIIELFVAAGDQWQCADLTALTGAPPPSGSELVGYDWVNGRTKQVTYVGDNGHIIELFVAAGTPWQFDDLTALTGAPLPQQGPITAYAWSWGATKQVAYADSNGHIIELFAGLRGRWGFADLTRLTRAPL